MTTDFQTRLQHSAIAVFTRYVETPDPFRLRGAGGVDGDYLAITYRRLGRPKDTESK